jgi:sialic acid synthase SpsE/RimJ/RimL family protein N-acetyltransferase
VSAPAAITFEIVVPCDAHGQLVMGWRNDPGTLAASFHRDRKVWDSFARQFHSDYFRDPDLPPLFAIEEGKRVAFLRFEKTPHPRARGRQCCDISINVAPEQRGRGLGTAVLSAVGPWLRQRGVDDVLAEIRVHNEISIKAFAAAGFEELDRIEKHIDDTGERCLIVRMLARLSRGLRGDDRVYVIAEAGSNWRMGTAARDRAMARALIDVAVEAGADAVKFQTYRPETVYVANAGSSDYLSQAGIKEDISAIFADLAMPYEMVGELADHCRKRGIDFMSTPFSLRDLEAIDPHCAVHKCASYENSHLRLLQGFARTGKPLIMSTGASTEQDIAWAVDTFFANGGGELCLLQCTARYPAPVDSLNLRTIPWLARRFGVSAGLSDHSRDPVTAPLAAVALGARVIEKHYTLDRRLPGPDHGFAITPAELAALVRAVREGEQALGHGRKQVLAAEDELRSYARRGVQAVVDIATGELLREGINIDVLRPGKQRIGVHPLHLPDIEGKMSTRDIPAGDGIHEGDWSD